MGVVLKTAVLTVTTAGTKVVLPTLDKVVKLYFSAPAANTGLVYVGDINVAIGSGFQVIKATAPLAIEAPQGDYISTESIYVDAATNGDKISVVYLQKA